MASPLPCVAVRVSEESVGRQTTSRLSKFDSDDSGPDSAWENECPRKVEILLVELREQDD